MSLIPYTAHLIVPTPITDDMLIDCTVPEPAPGEVPWDEGAAYEQGDEVIRTTTHRAYRRVVPGTTATPPEDDPDNWLPLLATLRWRQFDRKIGTQTLTESSDLVTVLRPNSTEGIGLMELFGQRVSVVMTDRPAGAVVYEAEIDLDISDVYDVYSWAFGRYEQRRHIALIDLPGQYPLCEITVTVHGNTAGAGLGTLVAGRVVPLGATEYGAGAGLLNFGKVADDGFGNREWLAGDFANRVTLPILAPRADFSRLHRLLSPLASTPCVYVGSSLASDEALVVLGVYRDLYLAIPDVVTSRFNLEIDGLTN